MKFLATLLLPSNLAFLLFLAGALSLLTGPSRRFAALLFGCSGAIWATFSTGLVAVLLLGPLEHEFPAMTEPARFPQVRTIVVLTAFASDDPDMPLSSRMNSSSAFRVLEAANLFSVRPDCSVIVSGGGANAEVMAEQLHRLGVPTDRITVDATSGTTAASAGVLAAGLSGKPVFLVTSAGHMRRAVAVFRRLGIDVVPVPADHQLPRRLAAAAWWPSPFHLQASDIAVHEYMGLAWYRLTGRI
jgi:uncharacterized SAM-binding protein YcdF (DUF218 family)